MDLSIIIPIFNTKLDVMKRCLESVIKIKNIEYEIILVDDGSDFKNQEKYKKFVQQLEKIKYITKENEGVSSARNLGIRESVGNYIMFVDSDDTINSNVIQKEYFTLNCELILFNSYIIKKNKKRVHYEINEQLNYIDNKSLLSKNYILRKTLHSPCSKLYKRNFLNENDIFFNEKMIQGEDAKFNLDVIKHLSRVYNSKEILYNYYYDFNTTDKRWEKFPEKMLENLILSYIEEMNLSENLVIENIDIKSCIKNKYLDEIFTTYLILIKKYNKKNMYKFDDLYLFFKSLNIAKKDVIGLRRIKYILIYKKKFNILKMLAMLRKIYLEKIKGIIE